MKIDIFNHILPPAYFERLKEVIPDKRMLGRYPLLPTLTDVEARFRMMDAFEGYAQVLSLANPPLEALGTPAESAELARIANDGDGRALRASPRPVPGVYRLGRAETTRTARSPRRKRAIDELGARGVQVFTNVLGKPISAAPFRPLFECLAGHDLPVWVHPIRGPNHPRLYERGAVRARDLVHLRLALRDQRLHGAAALLRPVRRAARPQDRHPPHGRHDPLLRGEDRHRLRAALRGAGSATTLSPRGPG